MNYTRAMEILCAQNITKKYEKSVLLNVSLSVCENECVGIVGKNGCGKSTLLGILSGGIKQDGGMVFVCGEDASKKGVFSKYVGYMPQNDPLVEELSVRDNLELWYSLAHRKLDEKMLERMGLSNVIDKRVAHLSGGMKRRVNMAGALASGEKLLVLDEPSTGLDILCRQEMSKLYREYMSKSRSIIMATHSMEEIRLCTRLLLLKDGKICEIDKNIDAETLSHLMED